MNTQNSPFNLGRLLDVEMDVIVRFGLTEIPLQEVVGFGNGSMIELNRTVDSPVELLVNNFPFAKGEVVVVDGYYSIKITELDLPGDASEGLLAKNEKNEPAKPVQNQIPPNQQKPKNQPPNSVPPQAPKPNPPNPATHNPPKADPMPPKSQENK